MKILVLDWKIVDYGFTRYKGVWEVHTIEDTPENILAAKMKYKVKYLKTWIKFEKSEESIEIEIKQINEDFDRIVDNYLSKYPKREQETFWEKKREAEKVLDGGSSVYIEGKAEALGISPEDFANIIIAKNNEWTELYTKLENEKDAKILALKS